MIVFVIILNLLFTLVNLYIVLKIWQWRTALVRIIKTMNKLEVLSHSLLIKTEVSLTQAQQQLAQWQKLYHRLQLQLKLFRQIITLV
ncbi:MAG: hypothetical protein D6756_11965, partial [Cyanobacteria bacterium J083]